MANQQLRDEVLTLFLAGHETTAVALTWTLSVLSLHPDSETTLYDELTTALGGRRPEAEDMGHLPYTERVVKESLRFYSPAFLLGREALNDFKIGGFDIPARTQVLMSPW